MSLDEARKAAYEAVDHILPAEAAECIGAAILSDEAIDAFLAALRKDYAIVPREASEKMVEAVEYMGCSEHSWSSDGCGIDYLGKRGAQRIWSAMIAAYEGEG